MNIIDKLKALLKEAELYHTMGLLNESLDKYQKATELIEGNEQLKSRPNLMAGITKKMNALQKDMQKVEEATDTPEVSEKVQDLIKQLFAFPAHKDEDATALDEAIALAKFGQYDRALTEFNGLLKRDSVRVVAAKNIVRCHLAQTSADAAVEQYEQWLSSDIFAQGELNKLRFFLKGLLKKEGIKTELPTAAAPADAAKTPDAMPAADEPMVEIAVDEEEDEVIDINSIAITVGDGSTKELDVTFQSGNVISMLIAHKDKDLIDFFNEGDKLDDIQFNSAIAIFNGTGVVSHKTKIESGPRRGDFSIDIRIEST